MYIEETKDFIKHLCLVDNFLKNFENFISFIF